MENWQKIEMNNKTIETFGRPRSKGRIRSVAKLVANFFQEYGRETYFQYKNKADAVFPGKEYFFFQRPSMLPLRCRSKHELLSMPYIFSDINLAGKPHYKMLVADFYSEKAIKIIDKILQDGPDSKLESKLHFEHVKPCNIINKILKEKSDIASEEAINDFLESHLFVAVLTKEENDAINNTSVNSIKCQKDMPDRQQYFSRYLAANEQQNAGINLFVPTNEHRERLISAQFPKLKR